MKEKAFNKKLNLNKKTIVNLDNKEMKNLYGGIAAPPTWTCRTCSAGGNCC